MAEKSIAARIAEDACRNFPDTASKTIARKLRKDYPAHFSSIDNARDHVRRCRGNHGKESRANAATPKQNGVAGQIPKCPPSQAEAWEPYKLRYPARIFCISDVHIPYHSEIALNAAVEWGVKFDPGILLINGDLLDFYSISRWDKDPGKRNFPDEINRCKEALDWLNQTFPKAEKIFKYGNHEERYEKFIWNRAPEFWGLENVQLHNLLELEEKGYKWVGDQRIIEANGLPILHGHEMPRGFTNPVNQARGAFLRLNHTSLTAHGHRTSSHTDPDIYRSETTCWSQGCLCDLTPEYARINKWNWGFCSIETYKGGHEFELRNYRINSEGKVRSA